ncbi:MAG: hypothetical protein FWC96_10215 [Oscillospiraceae bacterium]|nr:hypothetical protein [Oscillospiraceae bacterium]
MLTITISKPELKKAFSCGYADYSQELTVDEEPDVNVYAVLLKIILNIFSSANNSKEAV